MQIRTRLTIQFILIVASIMMVSFMYIYIQFERHLEDEFYGGLKSKGTMTAEMIVGKVKVEEDLQVQIPSFSSDLGIYKENISIYNKEGSDRVYAFNPKASLIPPKVIKEVQRNEEIRFNNGNYESLGVKYKNKFGREFIVVVDSGFNSEHLSNLKNILIWVFFIFISLVAIGGWIFSGQALAPINKIMNQVDDLLPSNLSKRLIAGNQHDEMARLVLTFNKLLGRIEQAFQTQKMFLSNVSHELKNPLNVISSQLEVTLSKERDKEEYKRILTSVHEDVQNLNDVAVKLMQMAKLNSDDSTIQFAKARIDEVIWSTKAALLKTHPEYKIHFEVTNLPSTEDGLWIYCNESLLKTALLNLMDNGCKFSPEKDVKVKLNFKEDNHCVIEILDRGPGIAKEEIDLVLEPFYRSAHTSNIRGSGIGLSLVQSIFKLHQVEMTIDSELGVGTIFRVLFPTGSQALNPVS